ncbi:MAG: hypothetical protein R2828_28435 [Saprospiraceae bacterium]
MRIIGYVEHPTLKITIFKMDTRLSIKFEDNLYEQTYKFRMQEGLERLPDIQQLVDDAFLAAVRQQFSQMEAISMSAQARHLPEREEEEFEDII